jgi:hypothetical protein
LIMLLFASPAWSAGNNSEYYCDNPNSSGDGEEFGWSDVTCLCSEPLTDFVGVGVINANPPGSVDYECYYSGNVLDSGSPEGSFTSVLSSTVEGGSYPLTVGGDEYVQRADHFSQGITSTGIEHLELSNYTFTDGTFCARTYTRWDDAYECSVGHKCNLKGPRFTKPSGGWHPGVECAGPGTLTGGRFRCGFGSSATSALGKCPNAVDHGCWSSSNVRDNAYNSLSWERMQTGWTRVEVCFDHNITQTQFDAMKSAYDGITNGRSSQLTWKGPDHVYMRYRFVQITGPYAGDYIFGGPAISLNDTGANNISTGTDSRIFSSGWGCHDNSCCISATAYPCCTAINDGTCNEDKADSWVSYMMVALKADADPLYWIGPAQEVEGGIPAVPAPTRSEGVNFGTGVSIN